MVSISAISSMISWSFIATNWSSGRPNLSLDSSDESLDLRSVTNRPNLWSDPDQIFEQILIIVLLSADPDQIFDLINHQIWSGGIKHIFRTIWILKRTTGLNTKHDCQKVGNGQTTWYQTIRSSTYTAATTVMPKEGCTDVNIPSAIASSTQGSVFMNIMSLLLLNL